MEFLNIFSSNATIELASKVVESINEQRASDPKLHKLPITELGKCKIEYFNDDEITCQYQNSIRDKKVYIFGQTGTHTIMEFAQMINSAQLASAGKIIAVIPYFGYGRQDKKEGIRGPIGAKLVSGILQKAGANSVIVIDLHSESIQGFFDIPVNHVDGVAIFSEEIKNVLINDLNNHIFFSPDSGGFARASKFAKKFGVDASAMNKIRSRPGIVDKITFVGDITDRDIDLVDDLCDTAGTICKSAIYLKQEKKVKSVKAFCTHPVLTGNAVELLENTKELDKIYISDTLPIKNADKLSSKFKIVSSSTILAKIIGRIYTSSSMNEVNT